MAKLEDIRIDLTPEVREHIEDLKRQYEVDIRAAKAAAFYEGVESTRGWHGKDCWADVGSKECGHRYNPYEEES